MFGYVTINRDELKVKDFERYKAYYCGLCSMLRKSYGIAGQLTLSYDMTFLIIFLTGLYESVPEDGKRFCTVHPGHRHRTLINEFSRYAADMNIILSYNNFKDNWKDDKKLLSAAEMKALKRKYAAVCRKYPRQAEAVEVYMEKLKECEESCDMNIDAASGLTGEMLSEIFVYKEDCWQEDVRRMAFFLGKFIYLMDAYEDLEKDKNSGSYNPLKLIMDSEDFEEKCENILTMMAAECSKEFEKLPVLYEADIIRNVLYTGMWAKYDKIKSDRERKAAKIKAEGKYD